MPLNTINKILIKRSDVSNNVPDTSSLSLGELGLNTHDGKIFIKTETPSLTSIKTFLNSDDNPFVYNESLSGVIPKNGGNTISEVLANVLGGYSNDISGAASTTINGENNDIESDFSLIGGGINNKIILGADNSFIAAGQNNLISHSNVFTLGSNLSSHASDFTYVNNISAQGSLYGDGSNLTGVIAAGVVGPDSEVRSLTANWESTYNTVSSLSAAWASSSGEYLPLSGGALTGTILGDLSATGSFYGDGSKLTGIVAGDTVATTLVRSNSANWDSVYSTVQSNSATTWNYQGTDLKTLSGNWQGTYTTVQSNSASWQSTFQASSAYVSSNITGVASASAINNMMQITQAGYNAITPDVNTLYIIVG